MPRSMLIALCLVCGAISWCHAADWPMWRNDPARSGETPEKLPETLHLQWKRQLPPLQPAYQNTRLQFDAGYEPIVYGELLIVASANEDTVTAYHTRTGEQRWQFFAEGPVRFAPAAEKGKIYFGSDDGHLYCLLAETGQLHWKFQAVPSHRKLLGNRRLISVWPVRGGPVVKEGAVYFAAGVWPMEGVFVYCLDAETGEVRWLNDKAGTIYGSHPHAAEAFGGLTPQGYLVLDGDDLVVPCGTAFPAHFNRQTGELTSFTLPKMGRYPGGWFAILDKDRRRGQKPTTPAPLLYDEDVTQAQHEGGLHLGPGRLGIRNQITVANKKLEFTQPLPGVEGTIYTLLVADNRLFAVTKEGGLYALGETEQKPIVHENKLSTIEVDETWAKQAASIVERAEAKQGVVLVWGAGTGRLAEALYRQTEMQVLVVDENSAKIDSLRKRWQSAGWYGPRLSAHVGQPTELGFPPYLAQLIVSEDLTASGLQNNAPFLQQLFLPLRPFGGTVCFAGNKALAVSWKKLADATGLANAEVNESDGWVTLKRTKGLPGAVNYTGGWSSPDERVKAPLGVLWFDDALGLFKRAPQPQFIDGVMIAYDKAWEGYPQGDRPPYKLKEAQFSDVYTGRLLSTAETTRLLPLVAGFDLTAKQPVQYRPASQTNAWSPPAPLVGERVNPLTGKKEPRVFPKSYGCDGGVDYGLLYTMRSGTAAFYDKRQESGTIHISGPRSGCTNSVIPANGLLNVPYFYQGCTCSYPLPVGLALIPMSEQYEQWTVWGEGQPQAIERIGLNFGAPGDRMTKSGTLWLEHPPAGGPSPQLDLQITPEKPDTFYHHALWVSGGEGWSWVAASGIRNVKTVELGSLKPGRFTVRLHFAEPDDLKKGQRVFDVALQGKTVMTNFDPVDVAGMKLKSVVKTFENVEVNGSLKLSFEAKVGEPILSGLEVVGAELEIGELPKVENPKWQD